MILVDTHAHLDEPELEANCAGVLRRAVAAGVTRVIAVGTTAASSQRCVALAAEHAGVSAAVGIQPNYCGQVGPGDWELVAGLIDQPRVVALGETGLDRYWDYTDFGVQQDYFDRHLRLAQARDLPFIVHMRDCEGEIVAMLEEARRRSPLRGVMHSFTGGGDTLERCLELGLQISFAGMVTFKKSGDLRRLASQVPADRLLIETDCPYLSPHPHRGQRPNEPALLVHTAACLAAARGIGPEELASLTTANALALFRLS